jgi:hypothetical protein
MDEASHYLSAIVAIASASTVTSTCAPSLSPTSSPFSLVRELSMLCPDHLDMRLVWCIRKWGLDDFFDGSRHDDTCFIGHGLLSNGANRGRASKSFLSDGVSSEQSVDVAFLVNRLTFFVGAQIGLQIHWFAAKHAKYFWEGAAAHNVPPVEGYRLTLASR